MKTRVLFVEGGASLLSELGTPHTMDGWVEVLNEKISTQLKSAEIINWFGNGGNFILSASADEADKAKRLIINSKERLLYTVSLSELYLYINQARLIIEKQCKEDKWLVYGFAFKLKGRKQYFDDYSPKEGYIVKCMKPGVALIVIKKENTNVKRGFVSSLLSCDSDDKWAIRSIAELDGVFRVALEIFN